MAEKTVLEKFKWATGNNFGFSCWLAAIMACLGFICGMLFQPEPHPINYTIATIVAIVFAIVSWYLFEIFASLHVDEKTKGYSWLTLIPMIAAGIVYYKTGISYYTVAVFFFGLPIVLLKPIIFGLDHAAYREEKEVVQEPQPTSSPG